MITLNFSKLYVDKHFRIVLLKSFGRELAFSKVAYLLPIGLFYFTITIFPLPPRGKPGSAVTLNTNTFSVSKQH